ncbi:hypothetical protein WMF04_25430 [Sorangium sp. So ce260]|uniref:hypothetical protein n=1 Tax=Sorangium sp. So ce260 TaxID=3133291 RepID=UPI003F5E7B5D
MAVASLAAASFIMLGSASASAKDHADWALDFLDHTVSNEFAGSDEKCFMTWEEPQTLSVDGETVQVPAWSGRTKGACFFVLSLQKAKGYTEQDFLAFWGVKSPTSDYIFDLINMSPATGAPSPSPDDETHFRRVNRALDIQKGDVLAIGATSTYAGHTVIVTGPAKEIFPQVMPRYSGTRQYAVPIVDSTSSSHGCVDPDSENNEYADSRWDGPCTGGHMEAGIGTATMRVYTESASGLLLGYTWSVTASNTSYYSPLTRPYRIGRLIKLPDPQSTEPPPPPP